jgi:elongation factor G
MFGYATALRSLTKGRASYSMEPAAFEKVPESILATIIDKNAGNTRAGQQRK